MFGSRNRRRRRTCIVGLDRTEQSLFVISNRISCRDHIVSRQFISMVLANILNCGRSCAGPMRPRRLRREMRCRACRGNDAARLEDPIVRPEGENLTDVVATRSLQPISWKFVPLHCKPEYLISSFGVVTNR
jgi:hypothetical protein